MTEFNITFAKVRPNRSAGTMVLRMMALVARIKLPSNMAALPPVDMRLSSGAVCSTHRRIEGRP